MTHNNTTVHVPILATEITEALTQPLLARALGTQKAWIVDCTFGGGGHTALMLEALKSQPHAGVWAFDQDPEALTRGGKRFASEIAEGRLVLNHARMSEPLLPEEGEILGFLADLGISSDQLDDPKRGMSFQEGETLDMRMDPSRPETALQLLKRLPEKHLADLIFELGEERFSRRIASAIVRSRDENTLPTTAQALGDLIRRSVPPPYRHGRLHPATRTFQALRIAVNQELEELDFFLQSVILNLRPSGRVAVLSFHSLEDRRVKERFRQLAKSPGEQEGHWSLVHKKAISASEDEIARNPRSRSAHLRIIERMR
jgi:16S rRNA (cytosine1402-N4)-methyltransferase